MNIGIRLHDTAPGTLEERLGYARAQGFSCVHLALGKVLPDFSMDRAPSLLDGALAGRVRAALTASEVECAVLGCYLQLAARDAETVERVQSVYRAHLRFAREIGAGVVGTETPPHPSAGLGEGDAQSEEALRLFIKNVKPVARWAEEEGAVLAIEPVACHIVSTPERAERVLEALNSDHVGIILDAVNLLTSRNHAQADAIIAESIRRFGDRVRVLHMKDYAVEPERFMVKSIACGTGEMRYERLLAFARANGLPMTLEDTAPDNAEAARLHLERVAAKLD